MSEIDLYNVLGVPPDASAVEIKARFRFLSHAYHPDKFGSENHRRTAEEEFKRINAAYEILSDPEKRSSYDYSCRMKTKSGTPRAPAPSPPPKQPKEPEASPKGTDAALPYPSFLACWWKATWVIFLLCLLYDFSVHRAAGFAASIVGNLSSAPFVGIIVGGLLWLVKGFVADLSREKWK